MDKQIEEMAKDMGIAFQLSCTTRFGAVAEVLVEVGYRKIPENAVVLTREEYDEFWKRKNYLSDQLTLCYSQLKDMGLVRKETAEKYHRKVNEAIDSVPNATKEFVEAWKAKNDEIAKEITEGDNG